MAGEVKKELINYFGKYITDQRRQLIEEKLNLRTRFITVVLEDIYNSHNASAVIRSCECFGIQDLHVVEQRNEYMLNKGVTLGSSKWITLHRYKESGAQNIKVCYEKLKSLGYKILATTSDKNAVPIQQYDLKQQVALTFGTELDGLTDFARKEADEFVHIPMRGFTESFNISVSAAICLHELSEKLYNSELAWQLNETQKLDLKLEWYRSVVKKWEVLEKDFFKLREEGRG